MAEPTPPEVTDLLLAWTQGDETALEKLMPIVYDELHRLARRYMARERSDHTLQTTALVNEAYLRLTDYNRMKWQDRAHFLAVCAQLMRRILVDHARKRLYQKRGAGMTPVTLEEGVVLSAQTDEDLVRVDDALAALDRIDPQKSRIVQLRFFGGLSIDETAEIIGTSPRTVSREWRKAKAWLYRELNQESPSEP